MAESIDSVSLLLALLNPFLLVVYLVDLMRTLGPGEFRRVLFRAGLIASGVFCAFALLGEAIFSNVVHADFASFQIFGGIIFVLIGLQFVFRGPDAIEMLRGESAHVAGAVAMPVLVGPGTISAAVVVGERHDGLLACGIVLVAVASSLAIVALLKKVHDVVRPRQEALVERYIEVAGRITALYVGTIAVEMILQGMRASLDRIS